MNEPTTTSVSRVTLAGLTRYPVKSCRGWVETEVRLTSRGLEHDREWMVVDPDGQFVTQRACPRMALVVPRPGAGGLVLSGPEPGEITVTVPYAATGRAMRRVTVWKHVTEAWDEGEEAAAWLTRFLERPVRLVRFRADDRRCSDPVWTGGLAAEVAFADAFALLVVGEESLADLNRRIGGDPLPMDRFRPNLVLRGGGAYGEDRIRGLRAEGVELRLVKPCVRCRITTIDQDTAVPGGEPLRTLATYRRDERMGGVTFGQNTIVVRGAGSWLRTGMEFEATT